MATYTIKYFETYEDTYEVEADTPEAAWDTLCELLCNGKVRGPDQCVNSGYEFS